jgi:hypothetical protein
MNRNQAADLAWALADSAASFLNPDARTLIFAKIGAGDQDGAIRDLLGCYAHPSTELPPELAAPVHAWIRGYVGSDSEPSLQRLMSRIRVSVPPQTIGHVSQATAHPRLIAKRSNFTTRIRAAIEPAPTNVDQQRLQHTVGVTPRPKRTHTAVRSWFAGR